MRVAYHDYDDRAGLRGYLHIYINTLNANGIE